MEDHKEPLEDVVMCLDMTRRLVALLVGHSLRDILYVEHFAGPSDRQGEVLLPTLLQHPY